MSLKTLAGKATGKVSRQLLTLQHHSPTILFGVGVVGVVSTAVLAARATLKLSDALAEGEDGLKHVEVTVTEGEETKVKRSMDVRLKTAIKVAKLYAPAVIVGAATVVAFTGSHVILKKRNAGLVAAYTVVAQDFRDYRKRVIEDQGDEKDLHYRFGTAEREIVEEGPNGPEVKTIRGLDQEAIRAAIEADRTYARIFDSSNKNWSDVPMQNQHFIQMVLNSFRDKLELHGVVFLSDVYDMLGFERTRASMQVGWTSEPEFDEKGRQLNDTYIDFGTWLPGMYKNKEWTNGQPDAFLLDFNVDGVVLGKLKRRM